MPPAIATTRPAVGRRYKWIALSNTTLGMLMATINSSIMLIALPDIFRGIGINPLQPGNTPFQSGLDIAFDFAIAACLIAAVASLLRGRRYLHEVDSVVVGAVDSAVLAERRASRPARTPAELPVYAERTVASLDRATRT